MGLIGGPGVLRHMRTCPVYRATETASSLEYFFLRISYLCFWPHGTGCRTRVARVSGKAPPIGQDSLYIQSTGLNATQTGPENSL